MNKLNWSWTIDLSNSDLAAAFDYCLNSTPIKAKVKPSGDADKPNRATFYCKGLSPDEARNAQAVFGDAMVRNHVKFT